ncbi:hypothetical protein NC651_022492 [Populus alba x Populus x berolinensis]|nr:hypothetical protein NC651_022492 [Populus alba x Populus x berolinensis]
MVAESKWETLVNYLKKKGSLKNCLAVYGISRDMNKMQKDICVSMGLLVSELSEEPWKGKIVSFGDDPKIRMIEGSNLPAKIEFMSNWTTVRLKILRRCLIKYSNLLLRRRLAKRKCHKRYLFSLTWDYSRYLLACGACGGVIGEGESVQHCQRLYFGI